MARKKEAPAEPQKMMRPATNPEDRENQLIALAYNLVEQRLIAGTASAQETTQLLKLGSTKAQAELEKLKRENELLKSKKEVLDSTKFADEVYTKALEAMREYQGLGGIDDDPVIL